MAEQLTDARARPALSGAPMIVFYLAMLVFTFHACTHMIAAGDTWVALACGRHFVNHGVNTVEPFSANSHRPGPTDEDLKHYPRFITRLFSPETIRYWHPTGWINQNWLTHVIFYWLSHRSPIADAQTYSYNSLVCWKFAIYIAAVLCVYKTGRLLGVNPALSAVFSCFAMFVGRTFLDIRPQGFSNLLVAVYLLILALATYRNILYVWLLVPLVVFWCNVHGGYVYAFVMLVPFVLLHLLCCASKRWFVSIGLRGVGHSLAAGLAALVAMIIFNPFHVSNLTHTFVISVSKHAELWRTVNEWHPAFEWANPVGDEEPFLVMFIAAVVLLGVWAVTWLARPRLSAKLRRKKTIDSTGYRWPAIDLAFLVIVVLTVYMAVRSRRFIPIAAEAACPVMAMLLYQTVRMIGARRSFTRSESLVVPAMPVLWREVFVTAAGGAVIFLGVWWGYKFERVYLDPWPEDARLNSVFMRMTASSAKPFFATQFIKENKLRGNMFNYWTEGGFIAYGQEPDPKDGRTPLQLFMDGRAQAAYEPDSYILWQDIYAGGPIVQNLRYARRVATAVEAAEIANWINQQLKQRHVWVVLLPTIELDQPEDFTKNYLPVLLPEHSDWRLVFTDDTQRLFVDVTTPQGSTLYEGIKTGWTRFPDEATKLVTQALTAVSSGEPEQVKRGFEDAKESFQLQPSVTAFLAIVRTGSYGPLTEKTAAYCQAYLKDFEANRRNYAKVAGYKKRLLAARFAANFLSLAGNDAKMAVSYKDKEKQYQREEKSLSRYRIW